MTTSPRDEQLALYAAYLDACNRHDWPALQPFLAARVTVNGATRTRQEYQDDLAALARTFPDYRWTLRHAVVEPPWLSVHLDDSGTRTASFVGAPGDGRRVTTTEFAMYRFDQDRIVEVWVTADNARLATTT